MSETTNFNKLVVIGLEEAKVGLANLQSQVHSQELTLVTLKTKLDSMSNDVSSVVKAVRGEGDGDNSLANRILKIENRIQTLEKYNVVKEKEEEKEEEERSTIVAVEYTNKNQLRIAMLTGIMGLIVGVLAAAATIIAAFVGK